MEWTWKMDVEARDRLRSQTPKNIIKRKWKTCRRCPPKPGEKDKAKQMAVTTGTQVVTCRVKQYVVGMVGVKSKIDCIEPS